MTYKNRYWNNYILGITLFLTAWLAAGSVAAQGVVVHGNVYGGGNLADVGQSVTVNISGGEVDGDVYGGGAKAHTNTANWDESATPKFTQTYHAVTIKEGESVVGYYEDEAGNTPATGNAPSGGGTYYKKTETIVNLSGGEVQQDVYGGGLGYDDADNSKDQPANVYGDVTVTTTGGKARDVFGANNVLGTPKGVVAVNINGTAADGVRDVYGGGNQATYEGISTTVTMTAGKAVNVYGGGLSADVAGSVTVNIQGGTVTTDVYGGGALGHTNTENESGSTLVPYHEVSLATGTSLVGYYTESSGTYTRQTSGTAAAEGTYYRKTETIVNLTDGSIGRDVYGGGLGRKAADAVEAHGNPGDDDYTPAVAAVSAVEAKVYGDVTVNIGAAPVLPSTTPTGNVTIGGSVFGCNNANGTPKGDVLVNVYKTAHTTTETNDQYPSSTQGLILDDDREILYALEAVYGGGNEAAYMPVAGTESTPHSTTVHVYGCSENTVKKVYGGGNAADVGTPGNSGVAANTNVIIEGGRFYNVFGGGNGAGADNPGANIYGTATTDIQGGLYNQVFGGSDSKGNVEDIDLSIDNLCGENILMVNELFGGANEWNITGNVTTTLDCSTNSDDIIIGNFYGGSNKADINGNVTLNIYGGHYTNVFGGSKGVLDDSATTDIDETKPANITGNVTLNLYGGTIENAFGGSDVNGDIGGKITVNVLDYQSATCPLYITNIFGAGNLTAYEPDLDGENLISSPEVNVIHIKSGNSITGNVYGGGKGDADHDAMVIANPVVNVGYDATTMSSLLPTGYLTAAGLSSTDDLIATVSGNVYGGGDLASVAGSTEVNLQKANSSVGGSLFGGGNAASVGNATVNVIGGSISAGVYGGCNTIGSVGGTINSTAFDGDIAVNVTGGTVGADASHTANVHGGGYGQSTSTTGNVAVAVNGASAVIWGDVYGGSALGNINNEATDATTVTLTAGTIHGNLYGGGLGSIVEDDPATTDVDESEGSIAALVNGAVTVTVNGGSVVNVFGCNNVNGSPQSTVTVDINNSIGGNVYGGGNFAAYSGSPAVNINNGTVTQSVYGGGKGATAVVTGNPVVTIGDVTEGHETYAAVVSDDVYGGGDAAAVIGNTRVVLQKSNSSVSNLFGGGNAAGVNINSSISNTGNTTIEMTAGTVSGGVYGGCNTSGTVEGNTNVNLNGGTIGAGTYDAETKTLTYTSDKANVHGGGYGENTYVKGNVNVNIGSEVAPVAPATNTTYSGTVVIWGDVYGGSALGNVNAYLNGETLTFSTNKTTTVNLYKGTVNGDVYGGGLGDSTHPAYEGGDVNVNLHEVAFNIAISTLKNDNNEDVDCATSGRIFGCNNKKGTPKGHVTVHIFNTEEATGSTYSYDLAAVFGGGNEADYDPTSADFAEVIIEGCGKTSINDVYGGGNAASVPATKVWIFGTDQSKKINHVFGGGNGELGASHAAHVGFHRTSATTKSDYNYTGVADGNYKTDVILVAGTINDVYGGSNSNGDIRGGANVKTTNLTDSRYSVDHTGTLDYCSKLVTQHIYGGGSQAKMSGDVNVILECMPDDYVDAVYGGAANATIDGNVTLTVTSGKFGRVFGGNNDGGSINGTITVNVYEDGCRPLIIGELYGAGNNAPYSIYGCTPPAANSPAGTPWTPNTEAPEDEDPYVSEDADAVSVYIFSCTSIGKVYGGGKGRTAKVIGNTHVWINMLNGIIEGNPKTEEDNPNDYIGKIGQVFGGGSAADVKGNTTIDIGTATVHPNNENKDLIGVNIIPGNDYLSPTTNTSVSITDAGVYGGGESADVIGNTTLNIGKEDLSEGTNITGNIFGGGLGETTTVTGSVVVNIGTNAGTDASPNYVGYANITGDVYGGSAKGKVNATKDDDWDENHLDRVSATTDDETTISTTVNFYGGTLSGTNKGNIYGGGLGDDNNAADVYGPVTVNVYGGTANKVFGCNNVNGAPQNTVTVTMNDGTISQSVYGGGNQAAYNAPSGTLNYPVVNINNGTVTGNVFGGGLGTTATVTGNPQVTIGDTSNSHTAAVNGSVYGGGDAGDIVGNPTVHIQNTNTTIAQNVFGAGKGVADNFFCNKAMVGVDGEGLSDPDGGTTVIIDNGTVNGNVYGGGEVGRVEKNTVVTIGDGDGGDNSSTPYIKGSVFGAGKGEATHGFSALVRGNTTVTVQGDAKIGKSVYGGGQIASVGRYVVINSLPTKPAGGGKCTVNILGHATIGEDSEGDVFGAGKGIVPYEVIVPHEGVGSGNPWSMQSGNSIQEYTLANKDKYFEFITTLALANDTEVNIGGDATVKRNVYGGSESGFVQRYTQVTIQGDCEIGTTSGSTDQDGDVYGGGRGDNSVTGYLDAGKVKGNTNVIINGGTMHGSVYGGGELGLVIGRVDVDINGGTINHDVYGGGALADTNTGNGTECVQVPGIEEGDNVTGLFVNTYKQTQDEEVVANKTYYQLSGSDYVAVTELTASESPKALGYYEWSESDYVVTSDATAVADKIYYTKTHPTTVNLLGGLVKGDAYGGGLGDLAARGTGHSDVAATVYGDINVYLGGTATAATANATAFIIGYDTDDDEAQVVKSGRVFGCNNLNGSPKGNVTVTVWQTVKLKADGTPDTKPTKNDTSYELAAVYGGGNLAPFTETGKQTHVIIHGCNDTSIETVYGGGNAAAVPETDVDVYSCYEIRSVFGGGNGKDKYTLDGEHWIANQGANVGFVVGGNTVGGDANTMIYGGTVHEGYGGSNKRGRILGNVSIDVGSAAQNVDGCTLKVGKIVGAGKEADIEGDLKIVMGCKPNDKIDLVFAGADNANVNGDVELTITSGNFGQVFGGNNLGGIIKGHIKLNIEETGKCAVPIIIDELYLGGNQAMYSMWGYYKVGDEYMARTAEMATITDPNADGYVAPEEGIHTPPYDAPELNIISCTRIGQVFGGGLGTGAAMYANPTVNINMIPGDSSYKIDRDGTEGADNNYHALGEIVDVFGGGNQAKVYGNTTVNIGTAEKVRMTSVNDLALAKPFADDTESYQRYEAEDDHINGIVEGAYITGNVYGGGNLANVTGKTEVNICAKEVTNDDVTTWQSVPFTASQVTIGVVGEIDDDHGNVFGGGKGEARESGDRAFYCEEAMVGVDDTNNATNNNSSAYADYGTHVRIGNGTVNGSVYGGGEIGRVEFHTEVVIGLGGGTEGADKSPVIAGSVFGAGKGNNTHGYSGLVRGDSRVTVQGDAKVGHSVYGGGEMASVGKYEVVNGLPKNPLWGGKCTVTIQGYAEIGPDGMLMKNTTTGKPDDTGHVFGAGKGVLPYEGITGDPYSIQPGGKVTYDENYEPGEDGLEYEAAYYKFIQSLGLASNTEVTIGENAFIKGSVYGGSENGYLQKDSHVTIAGGQIGEGLGETAPYADAAFIDPSATAVTTENALATCATWEYDKVTTGKPYDKYAIYSEDGEYYYDEEKTKSSSGGASVATDGHTYYGNVFGGGRGVVPFAAGKWHRAAGSVGRNTQVDITDGHILSSVYGGNEHTDVGSYALGTDGEPTTNLSSGGTCTINMSGGTVGVPRTQTQIENNPVIGNVFGAGKGDKRVLFNTWTNVGATSVNISGTAKVYGSVFGGGEDGHVINNAETSIGGTVTTGIGDDTADHTYSKVVIGSTGVSGADGNVFGGGRGSETALTAGVVGGNVNLTIDNGNIMGNVYGGGRLASVGTNFVNPTIPDPDDDTQVIPNPDYGEMQSGNNHGHVTVNINDGYIGLSNSTGVNGNIYGGSKGVESNFRMGIVKSTKITMTGGTAYASVYGGGELAQVVESHTTGGKALGTEILISGGTIGIQGQGREIWGNVFAGGKGNTTHVEAGLVKTNTSVTIANGSITVGETPTTTTPTIYHNIYGGGAYGSVGEFTYDGTTGMPTARTSGGTANITITGGIIGDDGQDDGMVFGSSRGDVGAPGEIHDKLAWVYDTHVTIGETSGSTSTPLIKGSVYGSGENGHTFNDAEVVVHSGTIGIASGSAVDGLSGSDYPYRGNVYGSGCGTDKYYSYTPIPEDHTATDGEGDRYNPLAGIVQGNTAITIDGGHVVRNVYGGGAMGSVGTLTNDLDPTTHMVDDKYKNTNAESSFALSWPYKLEYAEGTGKATITISGSARIGNEGDDDGNVYGAARGAVKVGRNSDVTIDNQRYVEALLANVRETEVKVNYETTVTSTSGTSACITGSVFGGGEDGHVYENAKIEITGGLIGHSVYGGGKGKSTFDGKLLYVTKPNSVTADDYDAEIHSWTAGRVYGNTEVLMSGGHVMRNIYGGGNLASVGKGNYAGGTDDYYPAGYGEKIGSALSDDTDFMGSGKAKVQITGQSIVGTPDNATEGTVVLSDGTTEVGFPTGNVFGSSRGQAAQDVGPRSPRYKYAPDFFLGYANETEVIIGTTGNASDYPRIYGSVYGGGRDGHVRRKTDVTIYNGKIGFEFTTANQTTLGSTDASNVQWKERGNVFGSGSGLGSLVVNETNTHGTSSGSVTDFTTITIKGGTICQNVYGGGALSSVGPPRLPVDRTDEPLKTQTLCQVNIEGGAIGTADGYTAGYGGNVYGAGRGGGLFSGENEESYATSGWTEVNMKNGTVNGNVFGGGQAGLVKCGVDVSMTGGDVMHDLYGGGALADTQTSNWNANGDGYVLVDGLTAGVSVVTGLYTKSSGSYTEITTADTKAAADAHYYNKVGAWADGKTSASSTTHVSLTGGRIYGDAYGGGLGEIGTTSNPVGNPAYVYGDVKVELNKGLGQDVDNPETGCIVNRVFGCNNLNGTPKGKAQVYVYATQNANKATVSTDKTKENLNNGTYGPYDVMAVYGGGNLSPYVPADALLDYSVDANKARVEAARSEVYIDGCSLTSIKQVYGGGNAAAASGTFVQVNRCYEIEEVFGGGNGYNPYTLNNETYQNPGANVGYYNYTHFVKNTTTNEYEPVEETDGDTKEERIENYRYGSGIATTEIKGGKIHVVYGGSNKKGNISTMALSMYSGMFSDCPMDVDQSYGGGKDADIDGEVVVQLNCAKGIKEMFGGSKNADVDNDIHLRVTNGSSLDRVFGGNNTSGAINGSITVDIEEGGCEPVIIKELYAGGYLAPYSVYGYEKNDDDTYKIKEGATDEEGNAIQERIPLTSGDNPKKDPRINVISATRIDNIYGGGYKAKVVGNPHINVNMKPGRVDVDKVEKPEGSGTYVYEDIDGHEYSADNVETVEISGKTKYYGILPLGTVGNIYGGGNEADIVGNTYVEIGTGMWLNGDDVWETEDAQGDKYTYKKDASNEWHWYNASDAVVTAPTPARKAAVMRSDTRNEVVYEGGNVYGGGNKGDVTGNTYVNICAYEEDDASTTDVIEYKGVPLSGTGNEIVTIAGNVFGGGKGIADSFTCAKGMVGEVDSNNGDIVITKESINKGTRVSIGNGTIGGSVYGGGEVGRVEWNGVVTIGLPVGQNETSEPVIQGDVFGGGKGVEQYGYAALLRGNTFVTVQANAKVGKSVYGGGEIASVGRYYIKKRTDDPTYDPNAPAAPDWLDYGMPYSLANQGSGYCNVIVTGNAEIGPDNMQMTKTGGPDDEGHVFGAGKGVLPYENEDDFECQKEGHNKGKHPGRMGPGNVWDCYYGKEADYLTFIETQALATQTEVLVDGNAFVKGSVYGGSLSGHVQHNTHVTIDGDCQIGVGYDTSTGEYQPKYTNWPTETQGITESWAECAHWTFDATDNAPYDPYAKYPKTVDGKVKYYYDVDCTEYANGGSHIATDGHTYYGNVFGGGSGVVPYKPGKWHREAGTVGGNTVVDITGGHILTSVYGGNEHTDVGTYDRSANNRTLQANTGKCTVNMIGGTVGVPRTKADILAHPVTCYVFGGGKGDSRTNFNTWTNVGETEVNISGNARIYGSTFGGGEDGHVLGDVVTNIGGTVKIGNTNHFYPTNIDTDNPGVIIGTQGLSGADGNIFGGGRGFSEEALTAGVVCGNVTVNIYKGTMLGSVFGGGRLASVGTHLAAEGTANYGKLIPDGKDQVIGSDDVDATDARHGHIAINIDGGTIGATSNGQLVTSDYSVGDVFGGSKGAGEDTSFGLAKYTTITMKGGTVNGNVYGGGELGNVNDNTEVDIQGGTIGKNVFGGGKGSKIFFTCEQAMVGEVNEGVDISGEGESATYTLRPGGTTVKITKEGRVKGNVYGGGEIGRVERNTVVTIGTAEGTDTPIVEGSVFGAGAGLDTHGYSALVRGTSTVTVQGSAQVWKNVYGGGEKASLGRYWVATTPALATEHHVKQGMPYGLKAGGKGTVVIQDNAVIGTDNDSKTGHVYGAGQGIEPRNNYDYASQTQGDTNYKIEEHKPSRMDMGNDWEYFDSETDYLQFIETLGITAETDVTIKGSAEIKGSVFGGSESGFVYHDTNVKIQNGTINGSAFGGGRGLDSFAEAGRVSWNTKLTMSNGTVKGNVYGGGNLGDVGTIDKTDKKDGKLTYNYKWKQKDGKTANVAENNEITGTNNNTGICTVTITGGTIGTSSGVTANHESGHVFGAGQGIEDTWWCEKAIAYATNVSVSGSTVVYGNVYGGGQVGRVEDDGQVTIGETTDTGEGSKPDIKGDVYGAGAGLETHGYSALLRGNAKVTVQRIAKVGGSVYGGGETASVGRFVVVGGLPTKPETGGTCIVNIKDNAQIGESGTGHNVYGACKGVTPHYNSSNYKSVYSMQTYENRPSDTPGDTWDYYRSYEPGYTGQKFIKRYYKTEADYLDFLKTLALTSNPHVTIGGTWTPNETTGTITASGTPTVYGSVYGGGQRGVTLGSVDVNMVGGTVEQDVYGGGALADTNLGNWDVNGYVEATGIALGAPVTGLYTRTESNGKFTYTKITAEDAVAVSGTTYYRQEATWAHNEGSAYYTTTVDLTGGTIKGNAYGGGLGQKHKNAVEAHDAIAAVGTEGEPGYVPAQPAVEAQAEVPAIAALVYGDVLVKLNENTATDNCIVKGVIHGANNYNGSPQGDVTVHVYKTVGYGEGHQKKSKIENEQTVPVKDNTSFDLKAVYGGGNEAAYDPKDPDTRKAHVIIDGCDLTSIETVYGGGNAASTPATHVEVNECYEIGTVFGGGNGKDEMDDHTPNPGADVGLIALKTGGTAYSGDPTKQAYGTGVALAELRGGTIHKAFGGSNTKGNIRTSAKVDLNEPTPVTCPLCIEEVYGAGNEADQDGTSTIDLGCLSYLSEIYGGAKDADVNNKIELTIQSGRFDRVFGGNNIGGKISGTITVNIEETGCHPIVIGQLFGGGNQAAYTAPANQHGPTVNVKSFTSIGEIYGGGFGASAVVKGDTYVNINEGVGKHATTDITADWKDQNGDVVDTSVKVSANTSKWIHFVAGKRIEKNESDEDVEVDVINTVWQPEHKSGAIGTIGNVFGGGNEAGVDGSTNVIIGTTEYEEVTSAVAGKTDVRGFFTRSGAGTSDSPYDYTEVPTSSVVAVANTTYYSRSGDTYVAVASDNITVGETNVSSYYVRSGAGTTASPFVYTPVPVPAVANTKYYMPVIGVNITGNVYGGGNAADVSGDTNVLIGK